MSESPKVWVPQEDGEVTIGGEGFDEPRTWRPQGHLVTTQNQQEVDALLLIDGARLATASESKPPAGSPGGDK